MKKFTFLFCLILVQKMFSQVTGVTVYTSSYTGVGGGNQPVSQAPNGDIYFYSAAGDVVRFSGGSFSSMPTPFFSGNNLFATASGVWIYDNNWGTCGCLTGNIFNDYSGYISNLIGPVSPSNPINYIGSQGSNVLIATNQGIIKFNGVNFSLINKSNSNLACDTVNCIVGNGNTTYIGTDKGLYTFNGNTFSGIIPLSNAPDQKVERIFSKGSKTIVTRKESNPNICFNYFELNGNQCNRLGVFADSCNYKSSYSKSAAFVNNNFIMNRGGYFGVGNCRLYASSSNYTTYVVPGFPGNYCLPVSHPLNQQKFYYVRLDSIKVAEIDIAAYSNYGTLFTPDEFKYLDTNQVKALIGVNSLKFEAYEDPGAFPAGYRVPKTGSVECGGGSSLWIGGLDNSGLLHLAGETYRQNGQDFWPGPLDTTSAQANNITDAPFNKVWKISCNQINQFAANANANNFAANTSTIFSDINSFIANGTGNFAKQLAPFYDRNNNGIYEPGIGEYPLIRGHQQIYSIYNDNYSPHGETGGLPLGVEVHERSFAYNVPELPDSMQVVNYSTFYNYEIINRSNNNYNNVYLTVWSDTDLGYYLNDYVGTDTLNQFGYMYNATNTDPTYSGTNGFQNKLPMFAYALLPRAQNGADGVDNNNNGQIDEPGERFRLNLTTYYNNNIGAFPPSTTNPDTKWDYYKYMSGRWKDSTQFKPIGNAYNPTLNIAPTNYVYTGNPQTFSGWTEATASVTPGDRRILCTIGPFNFPAKKKVEFEYAYIFSRDTSLNNVNNNFSLLQKDVRNVKYFMSQQPASCTPIVNGIRENNLGHSSLWVYPNPFRDAITINLDHNTKLMDIKVYDITGRVMLQSSMQNTYTKTLDLSSLSEGIYLLELNDGKSRMIKKVVKS
jgi:hypothetical protein